MWVKTKGKVTSLRDMVTSSSALFRLNDVDVSVPTLISLRKQHDVMQGSVERMEMTDVFYAIMFIMQNYIPVVIHILFSSAWNDGGHFVNGRQVVSTTIITLLEDYCHLQVALRLCRALTHDLISLLIQRDKWIVCIQHVLKFTHKK